MCRTIGRFGIHYRIEYVAYKRNGSILFKSDQYTVFPDFASLFGRDFEDMLMIAAFDSTIGYVNRTTGTLISTLGTE
jgi:hypothetical protein